VIIELCSFVNKDFSKTNFYRFFKAEIDDTEIAGIMPVSYVNESGPAVKKALSEFPSYQLIVIHDDLDIPFGSIRIKNSGSSGGHNGLKSIIKSLGTDEFWRIKVGIGRPPARKNPADFVLERFTKTEFKEVPFIVAEARDAAIDLIKNGPSWAMNKWH
jgi:PTH1 family peptidyl-tRNA hydrolase